MTNTSFYWFIIRFACVPHVCGRIVCCVISCPMRKRPKLLDLCTRFSSFPVNWHTSTVWELLFVERALERIWFSWKISCWFSHLLKEVNIQYDSQSQAQNKLGMEVPYMVADTRHENTIHHPPAWSETNKNINVIRCQCEWLFVLWLLVLRWTGCRV